MPKNQFLRFHDVLCTVIYLLEYSILFPMGTPVPISVLYHDFVLNKFIQTINLPVISHEYYRTHIMNKLGIYRNSVTFLHVPPLPPMSLIRSLVTIFATDS